MTTARLTCDVRFDLAGLMRSHGVTIRDLAARMGITMKRVREVRSLSRVGYLTYCDFHQAVTGLDVFCRGRYDAISRQRASGHEMSEGLMP